MLDNHICCMCGEVFDSHSQPATEYTVHGKGKHKKVNYFHKSCYYEKLKELQRMERVFIWS